MRFLTDFFSGIRSGMRPETLSYPTRRANKVPTSAGRAKHPALDVLIRAGVLLICVALGSVALYAASQPGKAPHVIAPSQTWTPQTPFPEEVLATDPSAPPRDWRYIVLHHSAGLHGSAELFDQEHRQRGWRCLGYHFVVGNGNGQPDGGIAAGPRWFSQESGAHANATEYNEHGIGICLVGNFEDHPPTPAEFAAVRALIERLCARYHIPGSNIFGHNQVRRGGTTACPGKYFPMKELKAGIQ
jgi:N-acetylmuramoyl-L-alanine amidase